jgi:hypothetical protein
MNGTMPEWPTAAPETSKVTQVTACFPVVAMCFRGSAGLIIVITAISREEIT